MFRRIAVLVSATVGVVALAVLFVLFGSGMALLSWVMEIFGEHEFEPVTIGLMLLLALGLLLAYGQHARQRPYPLLRFDLFRLRTFGIAVGGGFITRLGIGGLPFLMPLLYQLGLGLPAWESGLMMMPTAAAAMTMKAISVPILQAFGFRRVLIVNTALIGVVILLFAQVNAATPLWIPILLSLALGFFNSLQFSSMNSMAYADIEPADSSMASTVASSLQQLSLSFGLATGSLVTAWYLGGLPQSDQNAVIGALHHAFVTLGVLTILSSATFWGLRATDGQSVSHAVAGGD